MLRTESGAIREWVEHLGIGIGAFFERAVGLLQRLDWAREEMVFPVFGRLRAERVFRQFHVSAWDAGLIQKIQTERTVCSSPAGQAVSTAGLGVQDG